MGSKATEKAKYYALGKSSSDVFRKAHETDFINGYNQAIEDSLAPEMLEVIKKYHSLLEEHQPNWYLLGHHNELLELTKKATE